MYFTCTVFVVTIWFGAFISCSAKANIDLGEDSYSFVALIDIVLTDGAKRTCTGTIIHDNVVITAAHCFKQERNKYTQPEMTASFVVIGTKKMFDTGYEQYLPIERILIHPDYKGWSDDVALVFTFASMVSDKPGRIVPLANDGVLTPVDGNVTVISWGHCEKDLIVLRPTKPEPDQDSFSKEDLKFNPTRGYHDRMKLRKRFKVTSRGNHRLNAGKRKKHTSAIQERPRAQKTTSQRMAVKKFVINMQPPHESEHEYSAWDTTADSTFSSEESLDLLYGHISNQTEFDSIEDRKTWEKRKVALENIQSKFDINKLRGSYLETTHNVVRHYKNNWRRKMGKQQNKLTVEVFGFINVGSCRKIIEKSKPPLYQIQNVNEIICYASDDRFVTVEDSGAPAVRHGYLVAVTVGGAEFDGDQVALGMRVSCYCSWIAQNLPDGGPQMQCCTNCCDESRASGESGENHRPKRKKRKKKLL